MTALRKAAYQTAVADHNVLRPCRHRAMAVGMEPGDVLSFREVRQRRSKAWTMPIAHVFELAVIARAPREWNRIAAVPRGVSAGPCRTLRLDPPPHHGRTSGQSSEVRVADAPSPGRLVRTRKEGRP